MSPNTNNNSSFQMLSRVGTRRKTPWSFISKARKSIKKRMLRPTEGRHFINSLIFGGKKTLIENVVMLQKRKKHHQQ